MRSTTTYTPGTSRAAAENHSRKGVSKPAPVLQKTGVVQGIFEVGNGTFWNYVKGQGREQKTDKATLHEGVTNQTIPPFTTVGFEAEFAQTPNESTNPLRGTSHLELAESTLPEMDYTGLNFILETDANNAIELVTPPFLVKTLPNHPIPDPNDIEAINTRLKTGLTELVGESETLQELASAFNNKGIAFKLRSVNVQAQHLSHKNLGKYDETTNQITKTQLQPLGIVLSQKNGGITTQVNFATDAATFHTISELNSKAKAEEDPEEDSLGQMLKARFTKLEGDIATLIDNFFSANKKFPRTSNMNIFLHLMARNLSGQLAVPAIHMIRTTQEALYKDRSKQEALLQPSDKFKRGNQYIPFQASTYMSSFVKDINDVWIKDTLMNIALGLFGAPSRENLNNWTTIWALTANGGFKTALGSLSLPALTPTGLYTEKYMNKLNFAMNNQLKDAKVLMMSSVATMLSQVKTIRRAMDAQLKEEAPVALPSTGPTDKVDFMTHNDEWISPRQDTFIQPDKAQIPIWQQQLHVVETRRNSVEMLKRLAEHVTK